LNHTNIIKGLEWSENDDEYILVMECSNRPNYLKDKIQGKLNPIKNEHKMKSFTSDILEGLNYLHKGGIIHGDIKLENILYHVDKEEGTHIMKLCDFGLSRVIDQSSGKVYMETPVGSKHYMAPEIKSRSYVDAKVDMWALGVVLYKMSVAYKPTQIAGYKYGKDPIPFRPADWKKRSLELQDLIEKLLEVDPEKRFSAQEALDHPWFQI
jgi:serine/threonine protein kinase